MIHLHIKFVDTHRGAGYQVSRYKSWRLDRWSGRRYMKENKGVRWWISWWPRLGWTGLWWTRLWWARLGRTRLWRTRLWRTRLWWARLRRTWLRWARRARRARRARLRAAPQAGSDRHRRAAAGR